MYYTYNQDRVYPIHTMLGECILLQFEKDERITQDNLLGMGDAKAWSVAVRSNSVTMKPVADFPGTNLLIVTNKRTYAFEIKVTPRGKRPTYIIRFKYPDTKQKLRDEKKQEALKALKEARKRALLKASIYAKSSPILNTSYNWIGTNSKTASRTVSLLKPTAAWDDGRFTHLEYDNAVSLPNFYKVNPDGEEALINSHIDPQNPNTVVLHEVVRLLRVRLGKEVIELVNAAYKTPAFNNTGSGDFDSMRIQRK
ncbi:MAG: TrbG/VirB9 family P-type conjugative transfer protein [Halothiobacillaceae bacterium]|nr:TrbG/VirB9 family P-type conjugative transfer protein [Halothiobacillaceae bacterium]